MIPITKKNILRYVPCSMSRLHQVFIQDKGLSPKKLDKHILRLHNLTRSLRRRGLVQIHNVEKLNKEGQMVTVECLSLEKK